MQLECCNFFRNILDSTEELDIETQMLVAFACMQYGLNGVIIEQLEDNKQAKALFKALKANIDANGVAIENGIIKINGLEYSYVADNPLANTFVFNISAFNISYDDLLLIFLDSNLFIISSLSIILVINFFTS